MKRSTQILLIIFRFLEFDLTKKSLEFSTNQNLTSLWKKEGHSNINEVEEQIDKCVKIIQSHPEYVLEHMNEECKELYLKQTETNKKGRKGK